MNRGPDDFDRAFDDLIGREFPDGPPDLIDPPDAPPSRPPTPPEPAPFDDVVAPASSEPEIDWDAADEPYAPDPLPPMSHWGPVTIGGVSLVTGSILVLLALLAGVAVPAVVGGVAVLAFGAGIALLISQLPRHRPPPDKNGAVL